LITATVHGVGTATKDLSLVDKDGKSICQTLKIVAYSKVECLTKAENLSKDALAISVKVGKTKYECAVTDKTKCAYK
jgi:hypothetical protein